MTTPSANQTAGARILVAADHPVMRVGIAALLSREPGLCICAEAEGAAHALELAARHLPDLAVVDLAHETMGGLELVKSLRALSPPMKILFLSMHDEKILAERALRAGASGYVMKRQPAADLVSAVRSVLSGEIYLSSAMRERLVRRHVKGGGGDTHPMDSLSDREMEVLQLIGSGYGTRQIASKLVLSAKTIDSHRENLKRKLGIRRGSELVRQAVEWSKAGALP